MNVRKKTHDCILLLVKVTLWIRQITTYIDKTDLQTCFFHAMIDLNMEAPVQNYIATLRWEAVLRGKKLRLGNRAIARNRPMLSALADSKIVEHI